MDSDLKGLIKQATFFFFFLVVKYKVIQKILKKKVTFQKKICNASFVLVFVSYEGGYP